MKLQDVRNAAGLSQSQLAKKAGVSFKTIQAYEQGHSDINKAKLITLVNLATALDCKLAEILEDEELIKSLNHL